MDNKYRDGFFTSSQIFRLCAILKNGKPSASYQAYIDEIKCEIFIGRSASVNTKAVSSKWGSLMEIVLFNLIGLDYKMAHKSTIVHKKIKHYSGTPDLIVEGVKIGEIKSLYPKNFASLSMVLLEKNIELLKTTHAKEYWQCVSNAILCKVDRAELIVYMPYKKELEEIIEQIENTNFLERNMLEPLDYYFMTRDNIDTLPYLPNDSKVSNINTFEFEVSKEDKEFLLERVEKAVKLLKK